MEPVYLGDGVYADFDGYHIILKTVNPDNPDHMIFIEPDVWQALVEYKNNLMSKMGVSV